MNKVISAEKVKNRLYQLVDEVASRMEHVVITKGGKQKAVLLSKEEFDSWQETLEVASDKELVKSIKLSLEQIKEGKTLPFDKVIKDLNISV